MCPLFKAQAERMGVTVDEDGVPVIVAVPCPNERVAAMELLDPESVVEGTRAGAAREFGIEDLRVGEVLDRGHQLVSFDEFMTSARDAC